MLFISKQIFIIVHMNVKSAVCNWLTYLPLNTGHQRVEPVDHDEAPIAFEEAGVPPPELLPMPPVNIPEERIQVGQLLYHLERNNIGVNRYIFHMAAQIIEEARVRPIPAAAFQVAAALVDEAPVRRPSALKRVWRRIRRPFRRRH